MYCTSCGSKLPDNARFCPKCGSEARRVPRQDDAQCESGSPSEPVKPFSQAKDSASRATTTPVPSARDSARTGIIAANAVLIFLSLFPLFSINVPFLGSYEMSMFDVASTIQQLNELASYVGVSYSENFGLVAAAVAFMFGLWLFALAFGIAGIVRAARRTKYVLTGPSLFASFGIIGILISVLVSRGVADQTSSMVPSILSATVVLWVIAIGSVALLIAAGALGWDKKKPR